MTTYAELYADTPNMTNHWWWRPGWAIGTRFYTWHITQENQSEVQALVSSYQERLKPFSTLDLIPIRWLHMTVQGVGHVHDVTDRQLDAVITAVRERLATIRAPRTTYACAAVFREAIALPPDPPDAFHTIRRAIRAGITDALGEVTEHSEGYRPHVSVAYSNAESGSTQIRAALNGNEGSATATYRSVDLIELHRDHRMYEWKPVSSVGLHA